LRAKRLGDWNTQQVKSNPDNETDTSHGPPYLAPRFHVLIFAGTFLLGGTIKEGMYTLRHYTYPIASDLLLFLRQAALTHLGRRACRRFPIWFQGTPFILDTRTESLALYKVTCDTLVIPSLFDAIFRRHFAPLYFHLEHPSRTMLPVRRTLLYRPPPNSSFPSQSVATGYRSYQSSLPQTIGNAFLSKPID
jgi:hypothetical protein